MDLGMTRTDTCIRPRPGENIKALSLWEPWASLVAIGSKTIETRSRRIAYRGPLLICAALHHNVGMLKGLLTQSHVRQGLADLTPGRVTTIDDLSFGNAVAVVDIYDCVPVEGIKATRDRDFGDFTPGRFGWLTRNLRRLKPFPVKGQQGLFSVRLPADLVVLGGDTNDSTI